METSYTRESHLEKHERESSYRPGSLEARLNGGSEIIPTTKEEEWTTEKKKVNNKTRQIETRVKRQLLMEDGRVIADSGPKVSTRTKEINDLENSEDEDTQEINVRKETREDRELFEKLKNSDQYIQLPHQDQLFSERVHRSNKVRECKQENYRFHDEDLKELDALDIHRTATMSPQELLKANARDQDSFSDDEQGKVVKDGKFQLSKRNRGKLTHYSAKGYKIVDNDEEREVAEYDENGQLVKKRYRTHNHELINDDELPELHYDHEKYLKELKEVSGENNFIKIPPVDYESPVKPIRPMRLKQRSASLNNLRQQQQMESSSREQQQKYQRSNVEFQEESSNRQSRSRHRSSERLNNREFQSPAPVLTYRDRSESRQSSIINGNFEEKVNITETETYSNHTDNWLDNHFGLSEKPASRLKDKYRSSSCGRNNMEQQRSAYHHHQRTSYSRSSNQDACVQASFSTDESEPEIDRLRSTSRPQRTFYFGEKSYDQPTRAKSPLKSALKSTSRPTTPKRTSNYDQDFNERFNSMRIFNESPSARSKLFGSKELVHPIRLEKDENDNYMYSKKVTRNYRSEVHEPKWSKVDAKSYSPDFSSPYVPACSPRERIIPLRTGYLAEKPPAYATYRAPSRTTNLRSEFPEFSSLNSPSKISTLGRR